MKKKDFFAYLEKLEEQDEVLKRWKELYLEEEKIITTLIETRKIKGLSQKDIADITNLKQPAIARIENGVNSPQINTLLRIVDALDLKIEIIPKCNDLLVSTFIESNFSIQQNKFYSKSEWNFVTHVQCDSETLLKGDIIYENFSDEYPCNQNYPA